MNFCGTAVRWGSHCSMKNIETLKQKQREKRQTCDYSNTEHFGLPHWPWQRRWECLSYSELTAISEEQTSIDISIECKIIEMTFLPLNVCWLTYIKFSQVLKPSNNLKESMVTFYFYSSGNLFRLLWNTTLTNVQVIAEITGSCWWSAICQTGCKQGNSLKTQVKWLTAWFPVTFI